jgi:hypothetical protein
MTLQPQTIIPFPTSPRPSTTTKAKKVRFTQSKVEALRPGGGKPEYIYDSGKPGLAVRLTSGGARTFVFVGWLHGKVQRITLGRLEALPLAKARSAVDKIRGDIALGVDVIAQRRALRYHNARQKTLEEAFEEFIAGERHKAKTRRDYQNLWTLYVTGGLGRRALQDITAEDIRNLHANVTRAVAERIKRGPKERGEVSRQGHRKTGRVTALRTRLQHCCGPYWLTPAAEQTTRPQVSVGSNRSPGGDASVIKRHCSFARPSKPSRKRGGISSLFCF